MPSIVPNVISFHPHKNPGRWVLFFIVLLWVRQVRHREVKEVALNHTECA